MDVRKALEAALTIVTGHAFNDPKLIEEAETILKFILNNSGDPEIEIKSLVDVIDEAYNG